MMFARLKLAVTLVGLFAGAPAAAQPRPLPDLRWQAPPGCPQAQGMRERISTIAGAGSLPESRLQVEGEITKQDDGRFQLKLVLRDGELVGQRQIVSDSCEDLAGAAAVAVGLLLSSDAPLTEDQLRGGAAPGATPSDAPSTPPSAEPPATQRAEPTPLRAAPRESSSSRSLRAIVRAPVIVTDIALLPKVGYGLSLGAGVGYERWRLLATAGLWLDQTVRGSELPGYGADVGRMSASLVVGRGFGYGESELGPCVTLALENITARGKGPGVEPSDAATVWLGVGPGIFASLRLGDAVAVAAELGVRIHTARPRIVIDGLGQVQQLNAASINTGLGAEWLF